MKLVTAIIQPHKLNEVREALTEIGIQGLTISEVKGYGRQKGQSEIYRGTEYQINYVPKIKMEIAVNSDDVQRVVDTVAAAARTEKIGDGKIFVLDLENAMRIRTAETGSAAL